jgi:hypothetical protein
MKLQKSIIKLIIYVNLKFKIMAMATDGKDNEKISSSRCPW